MRLKKYGVFLQQRKEVRKDGKAAVRLILSIESSYSKYATGVYCLPEHWNDEFQIIVEDPGAAALNSKLQGIVFFAQKLALELSMENKLTPSTFKLKLDPDRVEINFIVWVEGIFEQTTKGMAPGTVRHYRTFLSKLQEFKSPIHFEDLTPSFLEKFQKWMVQEKGNSLNTAANGHKFLKKFLKIAHESGHIAKNPYLNFKVQKSKTKRPHLTQKEVAMFRDLFFSLDPGKIKTAIRSFLFSIFTGLSYADIYSLRWKDVDNGNVIIDRQKTGAALFVPINKFAQELMVPDEDPQKKVLKEVFSNQKTNDYLKVAAAQLGIHKNISFHVGRHTNAILSLKAGLNLSAVQSILGHSDIKTTQIYLQHYNEEISENAKKFNDLEF